MPFDLSVSRQSSNMEHAIKARMYKSIYDFATRSKSNKRWIKLSGLGIGIVSGLLTIAKRIACIAESLLKGVINIFGAPFSDQCDPVRGLKQIFVETPLQIVVKLPISLTMLIFSIPFKAFFFVIFPKSYAKGLWIDHDLVEKQRQIEAPKIAIFEKATTDTQKNPKDIIALKTLGDCYHRGFGTEIDRDKAIDFYIRAANLLNANSMKILGDIYEKEDRALSLEWYKQGADAGDLDAIFKMGLHHYSKGRQSAIDKAKEFFKQAAVSGHVLSKACLLEIIPADEASSLGFNCTTREKMEARSYLGIK